MKHHDFAEKFAVWAFFILLLYVGMCDLLHIKTENVRDAWNVMLIITGFAWGRSKEPRSQLLNN